MRRDSCTEYLGPIDTHNPSSHLTGGKPSPTEHTSGVAGVTLKSDLFSTHHSHALSGAEAMHYSGHSYEPSRGMSSTAPPEQKEHLMAFWIPG